MTKGIRGQALNCQGGEILKILKGEYFWKSIWRGIGPRARRVTTLYQNYRIFLKFYKNIFSRGISLDEWLKIGGISLLKVVSWRGSGNQKKFWGGYPSQFFMRDQVWLKVSWLVSMDDVAELLVDHVYLSVTLWLNLCCDFLSKSVDVWPLKLGGFKMRLKALKIVIKTIIWLLPLLSLIAYAISLNILNEEDNQMARKEKKIQLKTDLQNDVDLPVISVCSRNQFSQRDADKILEMEEWRDINLYYWWLRWYYSNITLTYSEFMSIFRNFAMHNMNPYEIENFSEDQKEFLAYHRTNFARLIKHQVWLFNSMPKNQEKW